MSSNSKYFAINKSTWNSKVKVHAESELYNMKAFNKLKIKDVRSTKLSNLLI